MISRQAVITREKRARVQPRRCWRSGFRGCGEGVRCGGVGRCDAQRKHGRLLTERWARSDARYGRRGAEPDLPLPAEQVADPDLAVRAERPQSGRPHHRACLSPPTPHNTPGLIRATLDPSPPQRDQERRGREGVHGVVSQPLPSFHTSVLHALSSPVLRRSVSPALCRGPSPCIGFQPRAPCVLCSMEARVQCH